MTKEYIVLGFIKSESVKLWLLKAVQMLTQAV